ncbi:MAG: nitroreductase family protein [Rikenellaceae bacterium]|nr:nitroreductase family protein [Rikenellaceae bacterium]
MKKVLLTLTAATAIISGLLSCNNSAKTSSAGAEQEVSASILDVIFERKSVRSYTDQAVEQEKIDMMVRAAMAAPSGMDRRPWEIVVVDDREILDKMSEGLGAAKMLQHAPLAMIVCGDTDRSSYWYLDCSAAAQNLLLAAEAQGLGAVWTAAYPYQERMSVVMDAVGLPENILPLAVIPVGYPAGDEVPKDKYNPDKVHYNKW